MSFSSEWETIYQQRQNQAGWPWSDVVSYVYRYYRSPLAGVRVLELGCGTGPNIPFFKAIEARYHAIEGSASAVAMVHARFPELAQAVSVGDFTQHLPDASGQFDIVLDRSSLTHNDTAAITRTVAAVHRLLAPGGVFIGLDWFSTQHGDMAHGRETGDKGTLTDFTQGQFVGYGQVHFSDEMEMRTLLSKYELLALEHKSITNWLAENGATRAMWSFAARRPNE